MTRNDITGRPQGATITRRMALIGAAASTTALAGPAQAAQPEEHPCQRASRLAFELSECLNEYLDGRFRAVVEPSQTTDWPVAFEVRSGGRHSRG